MWNLYRFNGLDLLNKWRGKKVMFVGDSLSENMWESMACLLHGSAPKSKYSFLHKDSITSLTFQVSPYILPSSQFTYCTMKTMYQSYKPSILLNKPQCHFFLVNLIMIKFFFELFFKLVYIISIFLFVFIKIFIHII